MQSVAGGFWILFFHFISFLINNDDGVWENANHSKLRLEVGICARFKHEIELNTIFHSFHEIFIRKFLNLYKKVLEYFFFVIWQRVWNVTRTLHAFPYI